MNPLARAMGFGLLESLSARLPGPVAMALQLALIALGTLLPLGPLLAGSVGLPELLVYFVAAMALSVVGTLVRLRTMARKTPMTTFLMLHYSIMIGILSLVCGVWAVILVSIAGPRGGWGVLLPGVIALVLATAWSLADGWFIRGGRLAAKAWQVVLPGYLRFIPLLLGTVFGAVTILGEAPSGQVRTVGIGLIAAQCVIDLSLAAASYLSVRRWRAG